MTDLTIKQLTDAVMQQAKEKGFGTIPEEINVPEKIALIQSEISEAMEAFRFKKIEGRHGFKEEMGDALQRLLHLCGILGINLENEMIKKFKKNGKRTWQWEQMNETINL